MNTMLRRIAWMLCGWIATGAGAGCSDQQGTSPLQSARTLGQTDMNPPDVGDMAIPGPTCEAANGLAADKRLLCVDFTTALPDAQSGWTFQDMGCGMTGSGQRTWKSTNGALNLDGFDSFGSGPADMECWFTSPPIDAGSYPTLTLSILQAVHLKSKTGTESVNQRAQILLEGQMPSLVQFTGGGSAQMGTGMHVPSFRRSMIQVQGGGAGMKFTFKLSTFGSAGGTGEWGWFIKSIAVLGHK